MSKKCKIFLMIFLLLIFLLILLQVVYKTNKNGNNICKSNDDLIEYILNITSYEAKLEVTINSNKITNKYELEQYFMKPNYSKQIVKEPKNIENLEIIYNENGLEVRNGNLSLSKIYQNYNYLNNNVLWLNFFIENYKKEYSIEENNEEIILQTNINNYACKEKLYINKKTSLPTKIEVLDNSNNTKVYIQYKEIKLNNIKEKNIFAFKINSIKSEI